MAAPFKHTLRPSSFPSFEDCGRRAAVPLFRAMILDAGYELRELGQNVGANVGTGVHAGAAYSLKAKMETGELGHDDEAEQRALDAFDERLETEGCIWDATTDGRNTAQKQIVRMTRSYRRKVAPGIEPVAVEERLEADAGDGFVVSGQFDNLAREPARLRDIKTGAWRRSYITQYGVYSMICRANGYDVTELGEDFIRRVRIGHAQPDPEYHALDIALCEWEARAVVEDIKRSVTEFERRLREGGAPPETAFRANPASMLCSAKWCGAWGTSFCRAHLPK